MGRRTAAEISKRCRMVAHCRWLMLDRETPQEGREEHRALIDYMEGQIEQPQERADAAPELRAAC